MGKTKMPFVEKYKPMMLDDMVLDDDIRALVRSYLDKYTMCNLLLVGKPGLGKSSLARCIVNELAATNLYINGSVDNNVDTMRGRVREFCCTMSMNPDVPKIVTIDEADGLSSGGGAGATAQKSLKNIIEENLNDTRFILTSNCAASIDEAIRSRCTPLPLRASPQAYLRRCVDVMKMEGTKYGREATQEFYERVVRKLYPDLRLVLNNLEHWTVDGELTPGTVASDRASEAFATELLALVRKRKTTCFDARRFVIEGEGAFGGDYAALARKLFDLYEGEPGAQIRIAEYMYRMAHVTDVEVQFAAMLYEMVEAESKK